MVRKRKVLEFIAKQTRNGKSTSFDDIAEELDLHPVSACDHLKRLWRERLIGSSLPRPPKFRYRLQPGESIRGLRFRLASRGNKRLELYRQEEEEPDWLEGLLGQG